MASPQAKAIENQFRLMRSLSEEEFDLDQERENTREAHELTGPPDGVRYERDELAGISVLRAIPERDHGRFSVVFLHGGAFCLMSSRTHHRLAGHIASACRAQVILPDYALAPERPFPAALQECVAVLGAAQDEQSDGMVALMGDSAGGGLALSVLLQVRDEGAAPPFAAVLMAPWLDLTLSSPSVTSAAESDVILAEDNLRKMAELYLNGANPDDPLASPLFGCFRGLPPLYVQASGRESPARRLHAPSGRLHGTGVNPGFRAFCRHAAQFPVLCRKHAGGGRRHPQGGRVPGRQVRRAPP